MYEESLSQIANYHSNDPIRDLHSYSSLMNLSQVVRFFKRYGISYTNTTIQHYVRIGILPSPAGRKYTHEHIALLAIAARLRSTFTLEEIRGFLLAIPESGAEIAYADLMELLFTELTSARKEQAARLTLAARAVIARETAADLVSSRD